MKVFVTVYRHPNILSKDFVKIKFNSGLIIYLTIPSTSYNVFEDILKNGIINNRNEETKTRGCKLIFSCYHSLTNYQLFKILCCSTRSLLSEDRKIRDREAFNVNIELCILQNDKINNIISVFVNNKCLIYPLFFSFYRDLHKKLPRNPFLYSKINKFLKTSGSSLSFYSYQSHLNFRVPFTWIVWWIQDNNISSDCISCLAEILR